MTEFLWALAAVGAVVLAVGLAVGVARAAGGRGPASSMAYGTAETRYEQDNRQRLNPTAIAVFVLVIGGVVGLALGLEFS